MPKTRRTRRKAPVTGTSGAAKASAGPSGSSSKPSATRKVIRRFHVLNKRQIQLRKLLSKRRDGLSPEARQVKEELAAIEEEINELGGLEAYQKMSVIGQGNDRGGGSEKVLIAWLGELGYPECLGQDKMRYVLSRLAFLYYGQSDSSCRVLEVGALKPDNFASCSSWMDVTCIDLNSRHPSIKEQDFLLLDEDENREKWDLVSLSLVVNFVPEPKDRGASPRATLETWLTVE